MVWCSFKAQRQLYFLQTTVGDFSLFFNFMDCLTRPDIGPEIDFHEFWTESDRILEKEVLRNFGQSMSFLN